MWVDPKFNEALALQAISMLEKWLTNEWAQHYTSEPLQVSLVRNVEDLRSIAEDQGGASFPYAAMALTNISPMAEMGGLGQKFRDNVSGRSNNSDIVTITRAIPVRIGMGFVFNTDNIEQVIRLAHILMFAAPLVKLRLMNDFGYVYNCYISIDPELTIPQADMGTPAKHYRFESTFVLFTWLLQERKQGVIRDIRLEVVEAGGKTVSQVIGEFDSLEKVIDRRTTYTEILDKASVRYKPPVG